MEIFLIEFIFLTNIFYYINLEKIKNLEFEFHLFLLILWIIIKNIYYIRVKNIYKINK